MLFTAMPVSKIPLNIAIFGTLERKTESPPLAVDVNLKYIAHLTDAKTATASDTALLQSLSTLSLLAEDS